MIIPKETRRKILKYLFKGIVHVLISHLIRAVIIISRVLFIWGKNKFEMALFLL